MIKFRQKEFTSKKLQVIAKGKRIFRNGKEFIENPGKGTRKAVAGVVEDPTLAAAAVGDVALAGITGGKSCAVPWNLKATVSMPVVKNKLSSKKLKKISKDMKNNSGQTSASKIGNNIEYYTNKGILGLGKLSQYLYSSDTDEYLDKVKYRISKFFGSETTMKRLKRHLEKGKSLNEAIQDTAEEEIADKAILAQSPELLKKKMDSPDYKTIQILP